MHAYCSHSQLLDGAGKAAMEDHALDITIAPEV
jgi:hypothetical protein